MEAYEMGCRDATRLGYDGSMMLGPQFFLRWDGLLVSGIFYWYYLPRVNITLRLSYVVFYFHQNKFLFPCGGNVRGAYEFCSSYTYDNHPSLSPFPQTASR